MTLEQRFLQKVTKLPTGCWLWTGTVHGKGYGHFKLSNKVAKAHRVAWELYIGDIPAGLMVLHGCDVTACVNPEHLFLGTNDDNLKDRQAKGRQARGEKTWTAKLDASQVIEIRQSTMMSRLELSIQYGVSKSTINSILNGETWRHL